MVVSLRVALLLAAASAHPSPPNFVVINGDDIGYGDLAGPFGHPSSETPHLRTLASEGLVLRSFYAASPVCTPSRSGLLTGRLMPRTGIYCANGTEACAHPEDAGCCNGVFLPGMPGALPTTEATIASLLRSGGGGGGGGGQPSMYRTAAIGKWHLGNDPEHLPTAFGFDHYFGVPHGLGACPCTTCFAPNKTCWVPPGRGSRSADADTDPRAYASKAGCRPDWAPCPLIRGTEIVEQPADLLTLGDKYVREAVAFIKNATAAGKPFFLYYASHHTHSPQFAGADGSASGRTPENARGDFGASLSEFDRNVGRLMAALASEGGQGGGNTLVIISSDNGPSLRNGIRGGNAGLLKCGKGTTYEGGQRVPGIAWWPGRIAPGSETQAVASQLDLLPTLLDFAGVPVPQGLQLDGYSMRDILLATNLPTIGGVGGAGGVGGVSSDAASRHGARNGRFVYYPQFTQKSRGAFAARSGAYKAHFAVQGSLQCGPNNKDPDCRPDVPYTLLKVPRVFNLLLDPGEQYPLEPASDEYQRALTACRAVLAEHEASLEWYPYALLNNGTFDLKRQPCCAGEACINSSDFPACCVCGG